MRALRIKLALYVTLPPLGVLAELLHEANIVLWSPLGLAIVTPVVVGLALLAGAITTVPSKARLSPEQAGASQQQDRSE